MTEATRREFLEVTGAAALGALSQTPLDSPEQRKFDAYGLLVGPEGARPAPDGEYFREFDTYQFAYDASDSQNRYYTSHQTEGWRVLGCIVQKNGSLYFRKS